MIFYEKPGCAGNAKQKELLSSNGISFEVKSILDTKWTKEILEEFFIGLEKQEIINPFAPQIKRAEINLDLLSKDELILMMLENPILIKRPLIDLGTIKICGFDIEKINQEFCKDIQKESSISTCQSSFTCKKQKYVF